MTESSDIRIVALNASPRKDSTTARLLRSFLEGAAEAGDVETELVNLYEFQFTGCRECYLCKMKGGKMYGKCGFHDGITELLQKVSASDGIVFGAPVFLGDFSAQGKAFLERLMFPLTSYEGGEFSLSRGVKPTAVIGTMNVKEDFMKAHYTGQLGNTENWFESIFHAKPATLYSNNTYQFRDYRRYDAGLWDEEEKRRWRDEHLPLDLARAKQMGREMVDGLIGKGSV
jgi:multimeric flavodoxin WrbA